MGGWGAPSYKQRPRPLTLDPDPDPLQVGVARDLHGQRCHGGRAWTTRLLLMVLIDRCSLTRAWVLCDFTEGAWPGHSPRLSLRSRELLVLRLTVRRLRHTE